VPEKDRAAIRYRDVVGDGGSDIVGQITELQGKLAERMASIRTKLAVMSGKGGVGKSTVTVNLAAALAGAGHSVGLLDADVHGPSIAKMLGVRDHVLRWQGEGVEPARGHGGMAVMGMDLLLPDETTPVSWKGPTNDTFAWRGLLEMQALRELLTDTLWGALDFLVIDLPPGTNQYATLGDLLGELDGTLVVSIPTEVSRSVVNRSITMLRDNLGVGVLGVVENMSGYYDVETGRELPLFVTPESVGYGDVPVLGRLPFDYRMAEACDKGTPYVDLYPDTPVSTAFRALAKQAAGVGDEETS